MSTPHILKDALPYKNLEKRKAYDVEYYAKNFKRIMEVKNAYRTARPSLQFDYYHANLESMRKKANTAYWKNKEKIAKQKKIRYERNKEETNLERRLMRQANPEAVMLAKAKARAKKKGIDFNIQVVDIIIPDVCPVLGIKIERASKLHPGSPTLDRVIPEKGYTKGNVFVISWRANRLKSDATAEELEKISEYIKEKCQN